MHTNKDFQLFIFKALGKFLYNKRVDKEKPGETIAVSKLSEKVKKRSKIPWFGASHWEVLDNVTMERPVFTLYLHENMPDFFSSIEEYADTIETFSHQEWVSESCPYSYDRLQYISELQDSCALCETLALTENNLHGQSSNKMTTMTKTRYFESKKEKEEAIELLAQVGKIGQIYADEILSLDMLTSSLWTV